MERYTDPRDLVDRIVGMVGTRLVVGAPLGVGKANRILDELYRRAQADPAIELDIVTALGLAPTEASSELERRLVDPINDRVFAGYPVPRFELDQRRDRLPGNVRVRQFYFQPGAMLQSNQGQRQHISAHFSEVPDILAGAGLNVVVQLVAPEHPDGHVAEGHHRVSLSSNPDVTLDALDHLAERRAAGDAVAACLEVNRNLPYMGGDAELPGDAFDLALDVPGGDFAVIGPPNRPVDRADHLIGLHASALVPDGGTLQIGIGALSDAIAWMLRLRQVDDAAYRALLVDVTARSPATAGPRPDGLGPFTEPFIDGLYACSEMLVDGFLDLMDAGVLRRRVHDDIESQRAALAGHDRGHAGGATGHIIHAAFMLGPRSFYRRLCAMPKEQRDRIAMTRVLFTNTLEGDTELKVLQRQHARFLNSALQVTLVLPADHVVPDHARANTPDRLASDVAGHRPALPDLPFGSDLTETEITLARALRHVQTLAKGRRWRDIDVGLGELRAAVHGEVPAVAVPYLERMGLADVGSLRDQARQALVLHGLRAVGALDDARPAHTDPPSPDPTRGA